PAAAAAAVKTAELRTRLARLRVIATAGKYPDSAVLGKAIADEAHAAGLKAIEAEALCELGIAQTSLSEPAAASTLYEAAWLAESAREDETAARARINLVREKVTRSDLSGARIAEREARAAVDRAGATDALEAEWSSAAGELHDVAGEYDQS